MSSVEVITDVISIGTLLKSTLEEEFIALSEKNLEHLESVQVRKVELLQNLESTWPKGETESLALDEPLWEEARSLISECKEAHIRNDLLLKRQLEVVRKPIEKGLVPTRGKSLYISPSKPFIR